MAATSVTGTGLGSADGKNKGSAHMTLGVGHLIGPRVVIANSGVLDGSGNLVVQYPALDGTVGDYIVMAVDADATAAAVHLDPVIRLAVAAQLAMDATSTTITLKGPTSGAVHYSVVKKGVVA